MKKILISTVVGFSLFMISIQGHANAWGGPVPVQSLKQAGTPPSQPTENAATSEAEAMNKVKEIMAAAKKKAQEVEALNTQATQTRTDAAEEAPSTSASTPASTYVSSNTVPAAGIEAQISQLNQNNLLFQQHMVQRFQALTTRNKDLEDKMIKLHQALVLLNQQMSVLDTTLHTVKAQKASQLARINWLRYGAYGAIGLLILILLLLIGRWRRADAKSNNISNNNLQEFDFMGSSEEGMSSKLDLARAYIAMGDSTAADRVIKEILEKNANPHKAPIM